MRIIFSVIIGALIATSNVHAGAYADNGDGTITDQGTTLMWQKQDDGTTKTWEDAISYCESLDLGGHSDWRLPQIKELSSLVDDSRSSPAINTTYFPGTQSSDYWSSTTYSSYTTFALYVNFDIGYTYNYLKSDTDYARCVR